MKKSKKNYKLLHNRKKKSKVGGLNRILANLNSGYDLSLDNFFEFLGTSPYDDLTMIIGIDYMYLADTNRLLEQNNHIDFGWTYNTEHRLNPSGKDNWYQINDTFNLLKDRFNHLIQNLRLQFRHRERFIEKGFTFPFIENQKIYNKLQKIIFDSSTTKFLGNTIFINNIYYMLLNVNGELYFEDFFTNRDVFINDTQQIRNKTKHNINDIRLEINSLPLHEYGNNYYIQSFVNSSTIELIKVDYDIVIKNNIAYYKKHLLNSNVEYINNISTPISMNEPNANIINIHQNDTYPIQFTNYTIGSYYKITKTKNLNIHDLTDISILINSCDTRKIVYF